MVPTTTTSGDDVVDESWFDDEALDDVGDVVEAVVDDEPL